MEFIQHLQNEQPSDRPAANAAFVHSNSVVYGHELRKVFALYPNLVNFNHGSFGTVPLPVMNVHFQYLYEQESCPEIWFRQSYEKYVNQAREDISKLIKAKEEDVVLVENASYAVNAILRSFPFKAGDKILLFSSAYRMVVDTIKYLTSAIGVEIIEVPILYPVIFEDELITSVRKALNQHEGIRMCIFSHISSMPPMIEPVKELTAICRAKGAIVLIDGAHAPGVIDIDVEDINAHYYTGNCHKWLFAPKGSAFLWVSKEIQSIQHPQPVVISSSGRYDYLGRFAYTGTRDYTAFATIPHSIKFIEQYLGGMTRMRDYCTQLLEEGCANLIVSWNTGFLVPPQMQAFMANVVLPVSTEVQALELQQRLMKDYNISMVYGSVPKRTDLEVPLVHATDRIFFIRVSAQVYLEEKDFSLLASSVLAIVSSFY